jgi:AcrR family transcriptional regulator
MSRPKGQTLSRKDVVAAAIVCLQREGESGLGVNCVARELGIQPPSIYKHIEGNEALRRAVAVEGMRMLTEHLRERVRGISDRQCLMQTIAYAVRQFFHEYPSLHGVVTTTLIEGDDLEYQLSKQAFLDFNRESLKPFGLVGEEVIHAIRMFVSACHGFVLLERSQQFKEPQSLDDSYDWLIDTFILALEQKQRLRSTTPSC